MATMPVIRILLIAAVATAGIGPDRAGVHGKSFTGYQALRDALGEQQFE